jgi:hypothetical protein
VTVVNSSFAEARNRIVANGARRIDRLANDAAETARQRCPVGSREHTDGTSHMRDTIMVEPLAGSPMNRAVKVGAPYAADVNYGHHTAGGGFVPADPFFSSAEEGAKVALFKPENLEG